MRRYDPQGYSETRRAKRAQALADFMARRMSEDVFRAFLYGEGHRGAELAVLFRAHYQDRYDREERQCNLTRR